MRFSSVFNLMATLCGLCLTASANSALAPPEKCERLITAEIVAIEQAVVLNRYGAFNPAGMLYALMSDVVYVDDKGVESALTPTNLSTAPGKVRLRSNKRPRPLVLRVNDGDCLEVRLHNLLMPNAPEERLKGPEQNEKRDGLNGATSLLTIPKHMADPQGVVYPNKQGNTGRELERFTASASDWPRTRAVSFQVNGLEYVRISQAECMESTELRQWVCSAEAGNVGLNLATINQQTPPDKQLALKQAGLLAVPEQGGLVYPGQSAMYRYRAFREGTYFAYSAGATVGGEGDGGQLGLGLFAAVNVQPKGSVWYRSQVTHDELRSVTVNKTGKGGRHPYREIVFDQLGADGRPVLAILDGNKSDKFRSIRHSDLNAIVTLDAGEAGKPGDHQNRKPCSEYATGNSCGKSYREFTVIMHDEVKAVQAFAELEDEGNPLHYIKDGMGINYGVGGMGAMLVAGQRKVGPTKDCPECRAEEFFLSSWANGDPALVLAWDKDGKKPVRAMYPDDPSNVHHSYLGDPVRFRNIHAGPKETHVFHLHAHQWVQDESEAGSTYLDSQTISPGATFSYEINWGGAGNRNLSPGDSIFHCHLYPHFAQGMWELWRVHDVFEDGTPGLFHGIKNPRGRNYPDAEIENGTANPALVPLPGTALAPMPTKQFAGYPFYIPGEKGHRPPQPPLDMDVAEKAGDYVDGGLQRHVLKSATLKRFPNQAVVEEALQKGGLAARVNATKVYAQNRRGLMLAAEWDTLDAVKFLNPKGEPSEQGAMSFHAGTQSGNGLVPYMDPTPANLKSMEPKKGYLTDWAVRTSADGKTSDGYHAEKPVFQVNGRAPKPGAPYADPCPDEKFSPRRGYSAGVIQTELTVNKHGWFDPQARILALEQDIKDVINPDTRVRLPEPLFFRANSGDCITFKHSNFVPNAMALDDFQIYTPTDTIGQHIHLVKFDVTSSDGSGNGWNYEDGTYSPEEVRERVFAYNKAMKLAGKPASAYLALKTHPLFKPACAGNLLCKSFKSNGECPDWTLSSAAMAKKMADTTEEEFKALKSKLNKEHPFCGAQRTVQRWWADPILDPKNKKDYTLRTVFTHDHFGPSTHQQHGLYAALVIEPTNSVWLPVDSNDVNWAKLCSKNSAPSERAKIIGGANLFGGTKLLSTVEKNQLEKQCQQFAGKKTAPDEKRPPFVTAGRHDGGPTSIRANIVAPRCIGRGHTNPLDQQNKDSANQLRDIDCGESHHEANDTKREFGIAFADFAILYNAALEPINPEQRDLSALRFGARQVPINLAKPLAISSEDPGTQLINYRNEPVPLRVVDVKVKAPGADSGYLGLGGFDYSQTQCELNDLKCSGDMANVFSTPVHQNNSKKLATDSYRNFVRFESGADASASFLSPLTRSLITHNTFGAPPLAPQLDSVLASIESWRLKFNCALYSDDVLPGKSPECTIKNNEPWRLMGDPATPILPVYEGDSTRIRLIQGSQEAQHVFTMNGVKWRRQPDVKNSGFVSAQPLGISEHFELDIKANPLTAVRTDYLYFGSSIDQLWDGMWGVLRSYGRDLDNAPGLPDLVKTGPTGAGVSSLVTAKGVARINRLAGFKDPPAASADIDAASKTCGPNAPEVSFDVSALRACQLVKSAFSKNEMDGVCGEPEQTKGVVYNQRLNLSDPNAIVYVLLRDQNGEPTRSTKTSVEVLAQLREHYATRRLEPLVLRAPAGACINVKLRNMLKREVSDWTSPKKAEPATVSLQNTDKDLALKVTDLPLQDGPATINGKAVVEHYSDNHMSMILDGFNYNQLRMSTSVGLSAPLVAQSPAHADGTNVGINALENSVFGQGSLVPACAENDRQQGTKCRADYVWFAGDYQLDSKGMHIGKPMELGALALRSFGDVIKHPAHGAIGALVIGPQGSKVCRSTDPAERVSDQHSYLSASLCSGQSTVPMYRDFVLVLQDAVDLKKDGWRMSNLKGAEEPDDYGAKAINYRSDPIWGRRGGDPDIGFDERNEYDYANALSSKCLSKDGKLIAPDPLGTGDACTKKMLATQLSLTEIERKRQVAQIRKDFHCQAQISLLHQPDRGACDPETPIFVAKAGTEVRLRIVHPGGHTRQQGITLHGHKWSPFAWTDASSKLIANSDLAANASWTIQGTYNAIGPMMAANLLFKAGGSNRFADSIPGDYLFRSQASFVFDGGIWGILRVVP